MGGVGGVGRNNETLWHKDTKEKPHPPHPPHPPHSLLPITYYLLPIPHYLFPIPYSLTFAIIVR